MSRNLILIVPSVRRGNGSGHLVRSIALAVSRPDKFRIYIDQETFLDTSKNIDLNRFALPEELIVHRADVENTPWLYILLDQRRTDDALITWLQEMAPLAGRDEHPAGGFRFDYLIESLPVLKSSVINLYWADPELIPVNKKITSAGKDLPERILFSFGGEDPAGLTVPSVKGLVHYAVSRGIELTVVTGDESITADLPSQVKRLVKPINLKEKLAEYDLLVCSYGLTALEAVNAHLPVITINPSRYHSQLARRLRMPVAGTGKPVLSRLISAVESYRHLNAEFPEMINSSGKLQPADLSPEPAVCPVCGSVKRSVTGRIPERTFYMCTECSIEFQQPWVPDSTEYNRDYFFSEYTRQYGRSYLEDFEHIKTMGNRRIETISELAGGKNDGKNLLDIGCAYGPFLAAAGAAGFDCQGVEPAEDAAAWVTENLNIPVFSGQLKEFLHQNRNTFDVITLWYVIEHLRNLNEILPGIAAMLKPGGVLAFATPNGSGITARTKKQKFIASSPGDHYTIWTPSSAGRILNRLGFGKIKFRASGIHRERFPGWMQLCWPVSCFVAGKMLLGDTFEVYAVKNADRGDS